LGVALGALVAATPVLVVEYASGELIRLPNVEENHATIDDWGDAAGVPSPLLLRDAPEVAALSDVQDETGTDREERVTSPLSRRREDSPRS